MADPYTFEFHQVLCPKVWNEDTTLKPEIRKKLLRIGDAFVNFLQVGEANVPVVDMVFTGSLANFNYSDEFSDIDLHVIVDMSQVLSFAEDVEEAKQYLAELYIAKKYLWNEKHNLAIEGFPVELYAQDGENLAFKARAGAYSIIQDEWLERPESEAPVVDDNAVQTKAEEMMEQIDYTIEQGSISALDDLKEKIRRMRQAGLDTGGEFSNENLVFKSLRRSGYIEKLWNAEAGLADKELVADSIKRPLVGYMPAATISASVPSRSYSKSRLSVYSK